MIKQIFFSATFSPQVSTTPAQPKENKTCPILIPFVCDDAK